MITNDTEFLKFIKLLSDNNLLTHVTLVGSWAEYIYKKTNILPDGYDPNIRTRDVDFLLKNMRKPNPPINLISLAKSEGYFIDEDRLNGTTKFQNRDFEIEFLIEQKGAGVTPTLKTNLGVTAQALRHMNILNQNIIDVNYLEFNISVPAPEAYAIHKIIINNERGKKAEKDMQAILKIWKYLDQSKIESIKDTLSKKEKVILNQFENSYQKNINQSYEQSLASKLNGAGGKVESQDRKNNIKINQQER